MCAIAGAISRETRDVRALVSDMIRRIRYRGPDDTGIWSDEPAGMAFGHARLSIHDLSPAGHQPMVSSSGRYVTTYNGEIYNFVELRGELQSYGRVFRGQSDTEVFLEAVEHWGFEASLARFEWDVCLRALGSTSADLDSASRPTRREAVVLWMDRERIDVCL